ncbi:MAG: DUF2897 domain-containing protein [Gammaproteobacteria bacterium]|nr:MAG: DUF2897 domain-containing protein [Gammaproteobacteria bacterium]
MSLTALLIITLAIAMIVSGILLLKKSAKKFNLTDEQLQKIKKRNQQLDEKEHDE